MMKVFMNIRLMAIALLVIAMGVVTSCDDDDEDGKSDQIELLSFGPTGVQHGDEIVFVGNNLNKVTAIDLIGASVPASAFLEQTGEMIRITVPFSTEEGKVTLKTPAGDIQSKTPISFLVEVTVESLTSPVRPGGELTITGEYVNWIREVWFKGDVQSMEVISSSVNELVVRVPMEAQTGAVTFITGGTDPLEIKTEQDLVITLPAITDLTPNPVEREGELTIIGTDLDLVKEVKFKGGVSVTEFVSQAIDKIVVVVPGEANKGAVGLVAFSGVEVESTQLLSLVGDLPPLAALNYAFFIDGFENGWGNWGWGGAVDFGNTENVRDGTKAIKKTFDGSWDALRFGGGSVNTAGYTEIAFSIFGTEGTGGKEINVIPNEQWGAPFIITVVEGEWTEYKLTFANIGSPATVTDFLFQGRGWVGTVYVDHVGFR